MCMCMWVGRVGGVEGSQWVPRVAAILQCATCAAQLLHARRSQPSKISWPLVPLPYTPTTHPHHHSHTHPATPHHRHRQPGTPSLALDAAHMAPTHPSLALPAWRARSTRSANMSPRASPSSRSRRSRPRRCASAGSSSRRRRRLRCPPNPLISSNCCASPLHSLPGVGGGVGWVCGGERCSGKRWAVRRAE